MIVAGMPHPTQSIENSFAQPVFAQEIATTTPIVIATSSPKIVLSPTEIRFKKIMKCESNGNPKATNSLSSAKGLYQILDGTWQSSGCTGDPFDPDDNTRCAYKVLKIQGWAAWEPSRSCWDR